MRDTNSDRETLRSFCEEGFDGDRSKAALALGRTKSELESMLNGDEVVDEDLMLKVRGISDERNISLTTAGK